ncbi:MAG: hypothetical protein ACK486_04965, partial [Cyanobacteriota bacterium]
MPSLRWPDGTTTRALLAAGLLVLAGCQGSERGPASAVKLDSGVPVGAVLALTGNANVYGQDQ